MKTIDEDIKTGQFKQAYLLYGEEAYLKKQYKDKLIHALATEGDTMNFSTFSGKDIKRIFQKSGGRYCILYGGCSAVGMFYFCGR